MRKRFWALVGWYHFIQYFFSPAWLEGAYSIDFKKNNQDCFLSRCMKCCDFISTDNDIIMLLRQYL
jgi:hypothetical protein